MRLWPLSRKQSPKQFLKMVGGQSLFERTVLRCQGIAGQVKPLYVTTKAQRFLVQDGLDELNAVGDILVEPVSRNTAAALCSAALWVKENYPKALMLILPSDQIIDNEPLFEKTIAANCYLAEDYGWVLLGVEPENPCNKFGYIQPEYPLQDVRKPQRVCGFIEKPDIKAAQKLVDDGWLWHAGISLVRPEKLLSEIDRSVPSVLSACDLAMKELEEEGRFVFLPPKAYGAVPALQIDKQVLEKALDVYVAYFDGGWRDVGSFDELEKLANDHGDGNRVCGDVLLESSKETYVRSPHRLTVAVGVENLNIIDTKDALLITQKGNDRAFKSALETLQLMKRPEVEIHNRVARPWGHFDVITETPFYKVKCILVRPGCAISRQFHQHRAEHWVVVKGCATITCDDTTFQLGVDESTFIPQGCIHRLENRGEEALELVEVQTGRYLDEDDIVRLDDDYGRLKR